MIACPYPGPNPYASRISPDHGCGGLRLLAGNGVAATCAPALVTHRCAVRVLPAPQLYFLFLGALDASLAHLDIVLYFGLRELSVLPEDDVEAHAEDTERDKDQCCNEYFHNLSQNSVGRSIPPDGIIIKSSS